MKVIGKQGGSFTGKDGKQVQYAKIFVVYDFPDGGREEVKDGECADVLRVRFPMLDHVEVGDEIRPVYNKYGRVDDIEIL